MFFDTHAHYDDERFDPDRDAVLSDMPAQGIELIVNPGCEAVSSQAAMALADRYAFVYAAVGWHPSDCLSFCDASLEQLRTWTQHPKVQAIGEIGLDYYYDDGAPREVQRDVFAKQLALAEELALPVIVHDRDAHGDCLAMVRDFPKVQGVFHCYSGSVEMAEQLVSMGWYLSFTGAITFKNARKAPEVVKMCPMERIMLETDSPYLAPVPHRGRRNDSRYLPLIAEKVGEWKGLSVEEVAARTLENGRRFFRLPPA